MLVTFNYCTTSNKKYLALINSLKFVLIVIYLVRNGGMEYEIT